MLTAATQLAVKNERAGADMGWNATVEIDVSSAIGTIIRYAHL